MHRILVVVVFLLLIQYASSQLKPCGVNGFGPAKFPVNINKNLREVKEEFLIACCNDHDVCYTMCDRTKDQCDSAF